MIDRLLKDNELLSYQDNPVVGVLVNGVLRSLDYKVLYDAKLEEVRLFSPLGRRIYRQSICFLLSYASSKLFPAYHLEISHSLGDGFFFKFTNHEVTNDEVKQIEDKMKEAVSLRLKIEKKRLPYNEAIKLFDLVKHSQALSLLESRNDSEISIKLLDNYYQIEYEPIVTNTACLSMWELRKYEDGMLLRHPQSKDDRRISTFVDNPLLFKVFKQSAINCQILKTESLGELNKQIANCDYDRLIELSESMLNRQISLISEDIKKRDKVKIVYIAGPSSSGKTTSALKLISELEVLGYNPIKISLDDYYLPRDQIPRDENGEYDFEVMEALNLDLFRSNLSDLIDGKSVHLPYYHFNKNDRGFNKDATILKPNSILVIEGIHGLNPNLAPTIDSELTYKIYISCLTCVNIDEHNRISTTDNRIIRRLIRDSRTRGIAASETLSMWPSVERGEKNHIFPYQNNADSMINSSLSYEIAVLNSYAVPLLRSVKPESGYAYTTARRLLKFLELCYTIPLEKVPANSILREFLGGSIYKAI